MTVSTLLGWPAPSSSCLPDRQINHLCEGLIGWSGSAADSRSIKVIEVLLSIAPERVYVLITLRELLGVDVVLPVDAADQIGTLFSQRRIFASQ